ncbi:MAG: ATP-dependent RecD-like DNA helicase [bacterium]
MSCVSGLIERVTFHNEETGFCVLRVKLDKQRDLVTVVGNASSINAGEWLTAEGSWIQDRDHGLQLKAEILQTSTPTSREGIEKYLASGLIKGIGPVYAKKLVETFGERVFDIIDRESGRLEQVRGIGSERRRTIRIAWAEQKIVREIMVFLHSNGVSTSRAVRIYKTYGDDAVEKVRTNPYLLARDITGIGFKTADDIACKLGIPRDSVLRARAGLAHVLAEASSNGHCALPRDILLKQAAEILEMDFLILQHALTDLIAEGELVEDALSGEDLIFPRSLHRAEIEVAARLSKMAALPADYPVIDADKALVWLKEKKSIDLAPSQAEALRRALRSRVLVITGGPGVGKTTLVNSILTLLRAKHVKCLLCAPTGRAAKRLSETTGLEAKTIHRLLEYQNSGFARNPSNPLDCDLLVADEASMLDVQLMSRLLQALPDRVHLILVGDVDQLPSVGAGAVLTDIINSGAVPVVRLTEIFRQASTSRIIVNAHRINSGTMPETEKDSDFFFIEREEPESIASTILELVAERIPKKWKLNPRHDIQVLCPMNRGTLGTVQMNRLLQDRLNPKREGDPGVHKFGWEFRMRDKVIQTRNNYDKEVFNGDIGEILKIDDFEREVVIAFDGREVIYDFNELDEISLAYAITIHKSQGSEFPAIVMPLAMQQYLLLQRNLIYTGITRGRRLVVLTGQKKALQTAVCHAKALSRHTALDKRFT